MEGHDGAFSNISVTGNYIGFGAYGRFYPGWGSATTISGNTIFDYTNPVYSTQAWTAYQAAGIPTQNLVVATGTGSISGTSSATTTLYGAGYNTVLGGSTTETNFVGGVGGQHMWGGMGANIFTYLAISDSTANCHYDLLSNFDSAKDVIDLSHIDADLTTAGVQNFTFIGTAAFSGAGAQVRYQQDPTNNVTYVEADLAGDSGSSPT